MAAAPPPPHLVPFARSVIDLLTVWPALQLSFEQSPNFQSPAAQQAARAELATELVGAFLDAQPSEPLAEDQPIGGTTPDQEDLEDFLVSWVFGTLDVRIEDESELSISRDMIRLWREWSRMTGDDEENARAQGPLIQQVERMAEGRRRQGARVQAQVLDEGRLSDDGESDTDDGMDVDVAPPQRVGPPRQASPIIDDEGFTMVTRSNQRH